MSQRAFHLDLNLCTGCHACAVACAIENRPERIGSGWLPWRRIEVFNEARHPGLPSYALSLGCCHCVRPPCVAACPAGAYAKDPLSGAVRLDAGRCLGCRYCTWVCPFDAPRVDRESGTVEKCTLCDHRLAAGRDPACVTACPTGALRLGAHDGPGASAPVAGFLAYRCEPALRLTALRGGAPRIEPGPAADAAHAAHAAPAARVAGDEPPIRLGGEWPLVVFTAGVGLLAAAFAALPLGIAAFCDPPTRPPQAPHWLPPLLLLVGPVAALVSLGHLGRPGRAWRALLHARTSWLSREILLVAAFLGSAMAWTLAARAGAARAPLSGVVALLGLAAAFAVDRVYGAVVPPTGSHAPGRTPAVGPVLAGSVHLAGLLSGAPLVSLPAALWKAWFALARLRPETESRGARRAILLRVVAGLALPLALLAAGGARLATAASVLGLAGEIAERVLFYGSLRVSTPRLEMARALARELASRGR